MKKLLALLACLTLMTGALAAALPEYEGEAPEGIEISFQGEALYLEFDDSPDYTTVANGMIQASFFTYGENEETLYELYLTFPEGVEAGDLVSPRYAVEHGADDCSVALIFSTEEDEDYYLASQLGGEAYPAGSDYSLRFDDITETEDGWLYTGVLTATLVAGDLYTGETGERTVIEDAAFSFTMPGSNAPAIPRETPKVTLPPDMYKV